MRSAHGTASLVAIALSVAILVAKPSAQAVSDPPDASDSARAILQRYADAWRGRTEMDVPQGFVLAFSVRGAQGGEYSLELSGDPGGMVREGAPAQYDIRFDLEMDVLRRLDRGEMGALTAMGQARSSDPIPLNPRFGEEFGKRPEAPLLFRRLSFHFWNRAWPEVIPFSESAARDVHGGKAVVFVYDREFRSAWYQLKPGMHINADPSDQTNTFPQLVVVTRGRFSARLDGRERILSEGEAVLIPPGMTHEFWAEAGQYGELIWTAFGDGA